MRTLKDYMIHNYILGVNAAVQQAFGYRIEQDLLRTDFVPDSHALQDFLCDVPDKEYSGSIGAQDLTRIAYNIGISDGEEYVKTIVDRSN